MKKLCLFTLLLSPFASAQTPRWIDVTALGVKCDGQTDDSRAILAAVQKASRQWGGSVLYFPPSTGGHNSLGCIIGSPLNLPSTNTQVTLYFDSQVTLNATLTIGNNYILHGNTPSPRAAFATDNGTAVGVGYSLSGAPAIHIQGAGIRLENLHISYVHGTSDGILIDKSSQIVLKNVWVAMDGGNTVGIPLHIIGGFGYYIEGGGYHGVQWDGDPRLNWSGIFRMRDTFFAGKGITVNATGGSGSMSIENILFEDAATPFLTLNSIGYSGIQGIDLKGVNFADSVNGGHSIVDAHGIRIGKITIINCATDYGAPMVSGDPITNLHVF